MTAVNETRRRRWRRLGAAMLLLLLFTCLSLLPLPGHAQFYGKNKVQSHHLRWKTLHTPHFEIMHYEGAEELAVRASLIAEQAYREYANRLDVELPWQIPFVLYASHGDFSQTNISNQLIGEGTGGFSEPFRNRMVLPYNGSHADFVHVIRHELVHVFMFHMAFGRTNNIGGAVFFSIPLWFAEGIAEWMSIGWDGEADMFIRDATINDYLRPLDLTGGFMVYKEGQAAMRLLTERYGEEKLNEFWHKIGRTRSVELALYLVYGLSMEDFNKLFLKSMRQRYWSSYGDLEVADDFARRLTDHNEEHGFSNGRPAISPDGDLLAFFSDRDGLPSLYLMSTIDGKIIRRLAKGYRSSKFESLHSFQSGICFDPLGREVAFIAKSGNEETLYTIDVYNGRITRGLKLELDIASSPAWSPDGSAIVLVGTKHGRTDLYLVDLYGTSAWDLSWATGRTWWLKGGVKIIRLTDDVGDESAPAWSPHGQRLAYAFNGRAEVDFEFEVDSKGRRRLLWAHSRNGDHGGDDRLAPGGSVALLDFDDGQQTLLFPEVAGRRDPVWIDDRTLCMINNATGIANLALVTLDATGKAVADERILTNVLGGISHPDYARNADRLVFSAFHAAGYDLYAADAFQQEWSAREPQGSRPGPITMEPPPVIVREAVNDTLPVADRVGLIEPYRTSFSLDTSGALQGGAIYFTSAGGLGMANVLTLSDMLGNHRLRILINFYGSFDNSDLAVSYFNLSRRVNLGVGAFHYDNFYNSFIATVGELLPRDSFFKERRYGVFALASYPFSTFERFDIEVQLYRATRTTFVDDESGLFLVEGPKTFSQLVSPQISFTHDTAMYGPFGPAIGSRYYFGYAPEFRLSGAGLNRRSGLIDLRKYWMPWRRNTFAIHAMGAISSGPNPRVFVLGGPFTLRGYDFYDYETIPNLSGSNLVMMNLEYRLPLVDYLIFGWPGRWGLSGIGATLFFDAGAAWDDDLKFFGHLNDGSWGLNGLHADYGFGIRTLIGFLPLRFDWAWKTDFRGVKKPVFHFSIGPEF